MTIQRGDNVPVIWAIKAITSLDPYTTAPVSLIGDVWELVIEWDDDAIRKTSSSAGLSLDLVLSRVTWTPSDDDTLRIPSAGAKYELVRFAAGGEQRTVMHGNVIASGGSAR